MSCQLFINLLINVLIALYNTYNSISCPLFVMIYHNIGKIITSSFGAPHLKFCFYSFFDLFKTKSIHSDRIVFFLHK